MGLYYVFHLCKGVFIFKNIYNITYNRGIILYYIIKVYENLNVSY